MSLDQQTSTSTYDQASRDAVEEPRGAGRASAVWRALSPLNISAIYLLIALLIYFSFQIPDLLWSETTLKALMSEQAVAAMVALALTVPLAAGEFDLSVGPVLGVTGILVSWLIVDQGAGWGLACVVGLLFGLLAGAVNGVMVVSLKINSFIATLATTSVLAGVAGMITKNADIVVPAENTLRQIGTGEWLGFPRPFWYMLVIAFVMWYVLALTPVGRNLFATGMGSAAARLAGVPTSRYVFGALLASGLISAFAGIITVSRIGASSSSTGPPFVLPAFAAAFVGATQFKRGQFNVWGTLVAVFVLALGVKGLLLMQYDGYVRDLFDGIALALAVGLASYQSRPRSAGVPSRGRPRSPRRRLLRFRTP